MGSNPTLSATASCSIRSTYRIQFSDVPDASSSPQISPSKPSKFPIFSARGIQPHPRGSRAKGDARNFAASVTDGFVAFGGNRIVSKQDRIAQLGQRPDARGSPPVEETSTRIYGDLAVTNRVVTNANGRSRQIDRARESRRTPAANGLDRDTDRHVHMPRPRSSCWAPELQIMLVARPETTVNNSRNR